MEKSPPKVELVPIDSVIPDPANSRVHPERNLAALKGSLARFGQRKPIVVDANGIVRAGNGTWQVAKALGWTEIWVARFEDLKGSEATAFSIADNRTSDLSDFDPEILRASLGGLLEDGWKPEDLASIGMSDLDLKEISPASFPRGIASGSTPEEEIDEGCEEEDALDLIMKAPFPWFGGKSRVARMVWRRFGDVRCYVEPFFGSGAVLLNRPLPFEGVETCNDYDGLVCNAWRSIQKDPEAVAKWADWPVNENDLTARHAWLVGQKDSLQTRLEGDPDYFDAKVAGWWLWGMACWIGGGFCGTNGPWVLVEKEDGTRELVDGGESGGDIQRRRVDLGGSGRGVNRNLVHLRDEGQGVNRKRVHLSGEGQGVNRQRVHLSGEGQGVNRQRVHLSGEGQGVNRQRVHLSGEGQGVNRQRVFEEGEGKAGLGERGLLAWMQAISDRLRRVRVCCGDWTRVCGGDSGDALSHFFSAGEPAGVFLDPPYSTKANRDPNCYRVDDLKVAHAVREWAIRNGDDPRLRIALCGYEGEHQMPANWTKVSWKAQGGMANQGDQKSRGAENRFRERVWFSPHCLNPKVDPPCESTSPAR